MNASFETEAFESLGALIGRLPDPEADREALNVLCDREHLDVRRLAKRLRDRRELCCRSFRDLFPALDLLRSPLAGGLTTRARNCLAGAGIESWSGLAATTPLALRRIPNAGAGTVEEILLLAMTEWASEFLPESRPPSLPPDVAADPLLDLIGRSPDPTRDAPALRALVDPANSAAKRFCEGLCDDNRRERPLRELLRGLDLIEAPAFSDHLDVRAANALGRVDSQGLSDLAGMAPAQIAALPGLGTGTLRGILTAIVREWAAAYLRVSNTAGDASRRSGDGGLSKGSGLEGLASAFEKLEGIPGFEVFRQRQLEDDPPSARIMAARLNVSTAAIYEKEARIERILTKGMRKDDWPIGIAVEIVRSRLGSVARPQDLDAAKAALGSQALPNPLPHRLSLLLMLGGYRVTREWILDRDIETLTDAILVAALGNSFADVDAVGRHLSRLGVREELQLPWLASRHGYKIIDGKLRALRDSA